MKESEFIEQNKEKWLDFENNFLKKDSDPSKTARLFIQITDDLSYARTFYPNRSVRLYLNGIAKVLFNDLNKSSKRGMEGFINFWKKDLPLTIYHCRRAMLISFLVFAGCFILGILTSIQDQDFARSILSNDYINMTNENIAKGDAMAVYKSNGEMETFLPILYNNLRVDFLTFFSGIFLAVGSLVIMVFNGVMVGVFQYFFIERGLFWESFLAIWTHGALEIPAIIISGGAGLTLGKGLLFPGTHSRFQAFRLSGMRGVKIILAVAPVTLLAAFIEGFLTRHTSIPDPIRFIFILLSFAFILGYFFFYPRIVARQTKNETDATDNVLIYKPDVEFDPSEIYSGTKVITETFALFFKHFSVFWKLLFIIPLACSALIAWNPLFLFHEHNVYFFSLNDFFNFSEYPLLAALVIMCITTITIISLSFLKRELAGRQSLVSDAGPQFFFRLATTSFFSAALYAFIIYTDVDLTLSLSQLLFPLLLFFACVSNFQNASTYESVGYSGSILARSWSKFLIVALVLWILSLVIYSTSVYGLRVLLVKDALVWMLTDDEVVSLKISLALVVFQTFFSFVLYLLLTLISNSLLFFTLKEVYTAEHLIAKIKEIKINK